MSKYAGSRIRLLVDENPRRRGTIGYEAWEKMEHGMLYEEYIKRTATLSGGGGHKHLIYCIEKGYVELKGELATIEPKRKSSGSVEEISRENTCEEYNPNYTERLRCKKKKGHPTNWHWTEHTFIDEEEGKRKTHALFWKTT